MRMLTLEVLGIAVVLTGPPTSVAGPPPRAAMPWVEIHRREIVHAGREVGATRRLAARLGAALAWDLADLPGHQTGASQPWGVFRSPPSFPIVLVPAPLAASGDGAIGALITRWNTLYPPYALEGMDDPERLGRREHDPSEEPSCPGN